MQATHSLPTELSGVGTGIPLPRLSRAAESIKTLVKHSDLLPTPLMVPISSSKAFVPFKLKLRRLMTMLFRVKVRKGNFL